MKRAVSLFLLLLLISGDCSAADAAETGASCAVLVDALSGRILYEQNIHERRPIASITKLMTALVAVEHCDDLEREVIIRPDWVGIEGSSIYLKAGEVVSMKALLCGLLLQSGNDAAAAIAGYIAGGNEAFAELMNRRAAELGMKNSSFTNPSGLNEEGHYSTAYDMALLACACLKNETVAGICALKSATVGSRTFYNHNKLLQRYAGCVGMKTGYTEAAGRTLVSAATREGRTLVCVTLNDRDDWNDHEMLLDYGFQSFSRRLLCSPGDVLASVKVADSLLPSLPVEAAEQMSYPLKTGEALSMQIELVPMLRAPVERGTAAGWVSWRLDGKVVARVQLVCAGSAKCDLYLRRGILKRICD